MLKKIIKLILILLCMATIYLFSSDPADVSTRKSDGIIIKTAEVFLGDDLTSSEKENIIDKYVVPVRKSAHFLIYFLLGFLILSYIKEFDKIELRTISMAILLCVVYACSDEIHQLSVSGRSGELLDVLIDSIGASVGCYCYYLINKRRKGADCCE